MNLFTQHFHGVWLKKDAAGSRSLTDRSLSLESRSHQPDPYLLDSTQQKMIFSSELQQTDARKVESGNSTDNSTAPTSPLPHSHFFVFIMAERLATKLFPPNELACKLKLMDRHSEFLYHKLIPILPQRSSALVLMWTFVGCRSGTWLCSPKGPASWLLMQAETESFEYLWMFASPTLP